MTSHDKRMPEEIKSEKFEFGRMNFNYFFAFRWLGILFADVRQQVCFAKSGTTSLLALIRSINRLNSNTKSSGIV